MLANWFARKNVNDTIVISIYTIFITVPFQVCSITDKNNPLQSGSVFYKHAKLTCGQYKHIVIFTKNGRITLDTKLSGIQMSQIPTVHSIRFSGQTCKRPVLQRWYCRHWWKRPPGVGRRHRHQIRSWSRNRRLQV